MIERLDAPGALLDSFIGQAWYQVVASVGTVGIGPMGLWKLPGADSGDDDRDRALIR